MNGLAALAGLQPFKRAAEVIEQLPVDELDLTPGVVREYEARDAVDNQPKIDFLVNHGGWPLGR
jgi:hypothetical protein